ncbi:MAG TPA: hypothetical protein DCQ64_19880 [Candidatus Rokubacteria bacterium]|nr:hypothetical protein [Candidatus Rokubacteria bacterium]
MLALTWPPLSPVSWLVIGAVVASVVWLALVIWLLDVHRADRVVLERALAEANARVGELYQQNSRLAQRSLGPGYACASVPQPGAGAAVVQCIGCHGSHVNPTQDYGGAGSSTGGS